MTKPSRNEILGRLQTIMHSLRQHMQDAVRSDGDGLGPMEARCLRYFSQHDGATQSDLVQHSGRDKAQVARVVKALLERGLLQTRPNPSDGRSQQVSVTAEGQSMQRKLQQHQARFEKALMAGLSDGERATLMALLDRLQDNVRRP